LVSGDKKGNRAFDKRSFTPDIQRVIIMLMKARLADVEIVTRKGEPVSVIIPIKEYEELLERLEDSHDVAWLREARKKPLQYRPLEEYLADRKKAR
jgi:prevent-host-death family protein